MYRWCLMVLCCVCLGACSRDYNQPEQGGKRDGFKLKVKGEDGAPLDYVLSELHYYVFDSVGNAVPDAESGAYLRTFAGVDLEEALSEGFFEELTAGKYNFVFTGCGARETDYNAYKSLKQTSDALLVSDYKKQHSVGGDYFYSAASIRINEETPLDLVLQRKVGQVKIELIGDTTVTDSVTRVEFILDKGCVNQSMAGNGVFSVITDTIGLRYDFAVDSMSFFCLPTVTKNNSGRILVHYRLLGKERMKEIVWGAETGFFVAENRITRVKLNLGNASGGIVNGAIEVENQWGGINDEYINGTIDLEGRYRTGFRLVIKKGPGFALEDLGFTGMNNFNRVLVRYKDFGFTSYEHDVLMKIQDKNTIVSDIIDFAPGMCEPFSLTLYPLPGLGNVKEVVVDSIQWNIDVMEDKVRTYETVMFDRKTATFVKQEQVSMW